ncbi:MAG: TrmH family RNA methyltransferase [Flavobacteriaceae bacterium]|nr:TrmH family RNA methyltransferase [Flavobacteriaceae bacterium]
MYKKIKNIDLKRKTIKDFKSSIKIPLTLILDNIRSLNNIGSVFRNADAFLIKKVFLCGISGVPPNKDINKTALGSTDSVEWEYYKSSYTLIDKLKKNGINVYAIEQTENAILLNNFIVESNNEYAFILGNEINGVSQDLIDLCDGVIEIPQFGTKHSLNIAVCSGIITWDFYNKFNSL